MRPNRKNRRIWSHLLKKLLMENYFLCSVIYIPLISKAKFDNPLTVHDAITRYNHITKIAWVLTLRFTINLLRSFLFHHEAMLKLLA